MIDEMYMKNSNDAIILGNFFNTIKENFTEIRLDNSSGRHWVR